MKRKRGDILIALLSLADIIVLINMAQLLPKGAVSIAIYSFDFLVVVLIMFSFCRRMKESGQWKKFLSRNWYEFPGMIPIVVFALAGQGSAIYDGFITVGVMLRVLAIIYLIKLSRSLEEKSRILGGHILLQMFIIFFLVLTVSSFLFYSVERTAANSQISSMGDALWWTIQTASTSTFGPNATTFAGRIVGSIIMLVGIGITSSFISALAAGWTKSRTRATPNENDPKQILKVRLAKGEITKEAFLDLQKLISD
jgi:voltage-gated potassium channel